MKILIKERLSQNRYKTPEGYLVCVDSIIARTGTQEYKHSELYPGSDNDDIIVLDRKEKEVFSPETIASFENKPLTIWHPDEYVNPSNYKKLSSGIVRDVKRGSFQGEPVLLGSLIIMDEEAIEKVESGELNSLSCGYDCDITDEKNPQQINIRGNHVALCEEGRGGITKIMDTNKKLGKDGWENRRKEKTILEIKKIIENPNNVLEDSEGLQYLTAAAIKQIKTIVKETGLTQKDMEEISKYWFGSHGYKVVDSEINDSNLFIYLFPDLDSRDIRELRNYNLESLGKNYFEGEKNYVVRGSKNNLNRYAKEYLDYKLHPDYLYKEDDFAGEIKDEGENFMKDKGADELYILTKRNHDPVSKEQALTYGEKYGTEQVFRVNKKEFLELVKQAKQANIENPNKWAFNRLHLGRKTKTFDNVNHLNNYSIDDALVEIPSNILNEIKSKIEKMGFKIVKQGKTFMGRIHYQVLTLKGNQNERTLKSLATKLGDMDDYLQGKYNIPMTFNIGLQEDGYISAGIDIDKMYVKDAKHKYSIKWKEQGPNNFYEVYEVSANNVHQALNSLANIVDGTEYARVLWVKEDGEELFKMYGKLSDLLKSANLGDSSKTIYLASLYFIDDYDRQDAEKRFNIRIKFYKSYGSAEVYEVIGDESNIKKYLKYRGIPLNETTKVSDSLIKDNIAIPLYSDETYTYKTKGNDLIVKMKKGSKNYIVTGGLGNRKNEELDRDELREELIANKAILLKVVTDSSEYEKFILHTPDFKIKKREFDSYDKAKKEYDRLANETGNYDMEIEAIGKIKDSNNLPHEKLIKLVNVVKSLDAIVKDNLTNSDEEIIDDIIIYMEKKGIKITSTNVIKELEKSFNGFVGKNKEDIIKYIINKRK